MGDLVYNLKTKNMQTGLAQWHSGRASNSESRGPGFDPNKRHRVVSLSKTHKLPTELVKPRKRWLHPDMTEKLLTGTLSLNTKPCTEILNKTVAISSSDLVL